MGTTPPSMLRNGFGSSPAMGRKFRCQSSAARTTPLDGTAPLHLYAYGAYGHAITPSFSPPRLSLLDRGFIYAIAHIRGGDDLGYHWYEDGKLDKRTNTFNDFVDVARHLVKRGYGKEGRVAISGASAGGELMGAAVNQAPELWGLLLPTFPSWMY